MLSWSEATGWHDKQEVERAQTIAHFRVVVASGGERGEGLKGV